MALKRDTDRSEQLVELIRLNMKVTEDAFKTYKETVSQIGGSWADEYQKSTVSESEAQKKVHLEWTQIIDKFLKSTMGFVDEILTYKARLKK